MRTVIQPDARRDLYPVGTVVHSRVQDLQGGYARDDARAVAELARLRKGAGKEPGDTPDLWGLTYRPETDFAVFERAPSGTAEEHAETAIHLALTLFALHQQSHRDRPMHSPSPLGDQHQRIANRDLGWAVRRLMPAGEVDERLRQRFVHLCTASTNASLAVRLRGIVQLLRREAVPLDYGLLADQLMWFQRPGGPSKIRRTWGRSFVTYRPPEGQKSGQGAAPDATDADTNADTTSE
ncbi:type I-E CRISPR-associated protein Cse2/CasB [Lipingzhangella sp. LS1_29]|uniref:Type I-E CRISPR-associated protein Cse2/CasB n=1 Tax=Lipingzhangella rawalii TaxID=2055835 RepID=A0ABU2HAB7_9ACTN|nr:type I-E CRISPR-associated protein Cse2/CasB [Lipingzhangella rawalii]MDS1272257.1 type I-E CRISPR-associated protein Cse2/CasB [Lipingzhangella rawalii]